MNQNVVSLSPERRSKCGKRVRQVTTRTKVFAAVRCTRTMLVDTSSLRCILDDTALDADFVQPTSISKFQIPRGAMSS